jgi:hypothetical protein
MHLGYCLRSSSFFGWWVVVLLDVWSFVFGCRASRLGKEVSILSRLLNFATHHMFSPQCHFPMSDLLVPSSPILSQ